MTSPAHAMRAGRLGWCNAQVETVHYFGGFPTRQTPGDPVAIAPTAIVRTVVAMVVTVAASTAGGAYTTQRTNNIEIPVLILHLLLRPSPLSQKFVACPWLYVLGYNMSLQPLLGYIGRSLRRKTSRAVQLYRIMTK